MSNVFEYVQSIIEYEFSRRAKPETQDVAWINPNKHAIHTTTTGDDGGTLFHPWVRILTPYAGDGYGMICLPRTSQKIVCLPIGGKNDHPLAIGRVFQDKENPPQSAPGDFLIHHETHSRLLFKYVQPAYNPSWGGEDGEPVRLLSKSLLSRSSKTQRVFEVQFVDPDYENGSPYLRLKHGDIIKVELDQISFLERVERSIKEFANKALGEEDATKGVKSFETMPKSLRWDAVVSIEKINGESKAIIIISANNQTYGSPLSDYLAKELIETNTPSEDVFRGLRLAPMKGTLDLTHYTGSRLFMDEAPTYLHYKFEGDKNATMVAYNLNATVGPKVEVYDKGKGKIIPLTLHEPKGKLALTHYTESGLVIGEKENQALGHATRLEFNLTKLQPISHLPYESFLPMLPNAQLVMEDITQDRRDVATQAFFRQMSSATISDQAFDKEKAGYAVLMMMQAEKGHYEINDNVNEGIVNNAMGGIPRTVALQGSGWFVEDYLKKYDANVKGWRFADLREAREQYKKYNEAYFVATKEHEATYDLDYWERIVPASGRRDVMLKREKNEPSDNKLTGDGANEVRLLNYVPAIEDDLNNGKKNEQKGVAYITEKNKQLIGQKGYIHKAYEKEESFQDGYLCNPKGEIAFRHYTRSGILIKELDPDVDYNAQYAAFSLFNWDLGQYHPNHTFSKERDERHMKFGPYPLPSAQMIMESGKLEPLEYVNTSYSYNWLYKTDEEESPIEVAVTNGRQAVMPTFSVAHTQHPQPSLAEGNESNRTTMATYGENGTWVGLFHRTSHVQKIAKEAAFGTGFGDSDENIDEQPGVTAFFYPQRIGSRLLFKDYIWHVNDDENKPLIPAAKWINERGANKQLIAPKGSLELQHYTQSGLVLYDKRLHYLSPMGGHSMSMRLSMRSLNFFDSELPVPLYKQEDGAFFCDMLSNEVVDISQYVYELQGDNKRFINEEGSSRAQSAPKPHGKRGAKTGIFHGTTMTLDEKHPCVTYFEDYVFPPDELGGIEPTHCYEEPLSFNGQRAKPLIMPKGHGAWQFYNNSRLEMGDAETGLDIPNEDKKRAQRQRAFVNLTLNEWNNREKALIPLFPAPYGDPSVSFKMECTAELANSEGKDATSVILNAISSKIGTKDYGSALAFIDYIKQKEDATIKGNTSAHWYKDKDPTTRQELTFPKGQIFLQHYNESGLFIQDEEKTGVDLQKVYLKLAMHEWDNQQAPDKGEPFDQDSTILIMEEILPAATREGKRASKINLEALTSKSESAEFGNCLVFEDFQDKGSPAHIYEGGGGQTAGRKKVQFPKGKIELKHYTGTGLYLEDKEKTGASNHAPSAILRLKQWAENRPEENDLAKFFAYDTTTAKNEVAVYIGFDHEKTKSRHYIEDQNTGKDDHKIQCGIYHWNTSYLRFDDLTTKDNKQVDIMLYHMKDSYLRFYQKNETPGDMLVDLHHTKDSGFRVNDNSGQITLTVYHQSGSKIEIDPQGNVTVNSVKNIVATAAQNITAIAGQSASIQAPSITLTGNVTINGPLSVSGPITSGGIVSSAGFTATGGAWHMP